jgi:exopolysaccharide biosynthesis WecB/TagA/CpsF family protein
MSYTVVPFLNVDFTALSRRAAMEAVVAESEKLQFGYVVTPNVAYVVDLHADPALRGPLYVAASLRLNDSRILELLAKWSGLSLPVSTGSDLTEDLFEQVITPDEDLTVIGGDASLIAELKARFGLKRLHWHDAPMGLARKPEAIAAAAAFVAAHPARFVFICVGAPQELMVAKAVLERGDARGIGLCVGASLEFLTGRVARAPLWMQKARLEWLFRLMSEPRRLARRYLIEGPQILSIWLRWRTAQR